MRDGQGFSDTRKVNDLDSEVSWLEWRARAAAYCRAFHGLSPEEGEDIAGEAVSRAWAARDRFDSARPFAPWFFTIVRRLALDAVAKNLGKKKEDSSATLGILPSPLAMGILVFTLATPGELASRLASSATWEGLERIGGRIRKGITVAVQDFGVGEGDSRMRFLGR